jgi:hypothetical protein
MRNKAGHHNSRRAENKKQKAEGRKAEGAV